MYQESTSGQQLRQLRERSGLSLSALAGRTHYSIGYLSRVETGERALTADVRAAYARALGMSALDSDPLRVAHEWLVSDTPQTVESRAGRRIGRSLVEQLERRVIELRYLDDEIAGKDLAPIVVKELHDSIALANEASYSEANGRRLLTSVGELSQLAGWVASDAGQHRQAQRFYLGGVDAATTAGDRGLAGNLLSSLSYQMSNTGESRNALLLARTAAKGAYDAAPVVRALLWERVAWAAAKSGDAVTAARVLDAVDDIFESRSPGDEEPEWTYWLSRDEVDTMRARCAVELGRPDEAETLLTPVLARYPETSKRESALYWSWLSEAFARAGDTDRATETLDTVKDFARLVNSQRVDDRIEAVERLLTKN